MNNDGNKHNDFISMCGYEAKNISGKWRVGMKGNLDTVHDAEIVVNAMTGDEWAENVAKRIAKAMSKDDFWK